MHTYGRSFRIMRRIARCVFPKYTCEEAINKQKGVVFVCRHRNMNGPLTTVTWLNVPVRTWVLHVFCDREACFEQYYGFTLTKRLHWPKPVAYACARIFSTLQTPLFASGRAIPVYRNSAKVISTYRMSLEALREGENILLFPDVEYTNAGDTVSELYDGYLMLYRLYRRETGKNLQFIPLYVDEKARMIRMGNAVTFDGEGDFAAQKSRAAQKMTEELTRLSKHNPQQN